MSFHNILSLFQVVKQVVKMSIHKTLSPFARKKKVIKNDIHTFYHFHKYF